MKRTFRLFLAAVVAAAGLAAAEPGRADNHSQGGDVVPLSKVVKSVKRQFNCKVLDADSHDYGGAVIYRVRCLNKQGQVLDVGVDAASGQVIDVQGGGQ